MSESGRDGTPRTRARVGYLVNRYPAVTHTFIRREIAGLEAAGVEVLRFSIRPMGKDLPDPEDRREGARTRALLGRPRARLLLAAAAALLLRPLPSLRSLGLAVRLGWSSDRGLLRHLAYWAEACLLLRWCREAGLRRLHAHFGTNSAMVAMLCRELGGPAYSFTVHGPDEFDKALAISLPEKIRRAEFVVGVSAFGRSQLYRWCEPAAWPKVHVIRCGVDEAFLAAPRRPTPSARRLVSCGRLSVAKGHPLLLSACAELLRRGLEFELLLLGEGELRPELERMLREGGLEGLVRLAGAVDGARVREELSAARALVLPSLAEGLPVALMEAMALGRAVIATRIAGIPELVSDGECGWLVPPGAVEPLADAMGEALSADPRALDEMGRRGAERVARLHDARAEARRLAVLLASDAEAPGRSRPSRSA